MFAYNGIEVVFLNKQRDKIIFHIDANSAYLSWSAVYLLQQGAKIDLRTVPSIVGGSENSRHGIVLAKSLDAKRLGVATGMPVREAYQRCPELISVPPNYQLYMKCHRAMLKIFKEYSDKCFPYSIDEVFLDMTHSLHLFGNDPVNVAHQIKDRIENELGFQCNVGIGTNRIQCKSASDFKQKNAVHTCWPEEIEAKLWPLPVGDLFMVGSATLPKLKKLGIYTIGDLANTDPKILESHLKSHGRLIYNYAHGRMSSSSISSNANFMKGIGNGSTSSFDITTEKEAFMLLLSLIENVGIRLRAVQMSANVVQISITDTNFITRSRQRKLMSQIDTTKDIYQVSKELFRELWTGYPIRKLRVRVTDLVENTKVQVSLFDNPATEKQKKADNAMDSIRKRFGNKSIIRACFANTPYTPIQGGMPTDDYPMLSSQI